MEAFIKPTQARVEGRVKLKLYKGSLSIVGLESPYSLYDRSLSTYGINSTFDQEHSAGFIELWGLQSRIASEIIRKLGADR